MPIKIFGWTILLGSTIGVVVAMPYILDNNLYYIHAGWFMLVVLALELVKGE